MTLFALAHQLRRITANTPDTKRQVQLVQKEAKRILTSKDDLNGLGKALRSILKNDEFQGFVTVHEENPAHQPDSVSRGWEVIKVNSLLTPDVAQRKVQHRSKKKGMIQFAAIPIGLDYPAIRI